MKATPLIILGLLLNLGAFVCYPETGRMGMTFLYVSMMLWTAFALLITRYSPGPGPAWKTVQLMFFAVACAFSALSLLPQKDGISALTKFNKGQYPDKRDVYLGLLRLGINYPALLPPQKEEILP